MRQVTLAFGCVVGLLAASCGSELKSPSSSSVIPVSTAAADGVSSATGAECEGAAPDVIVGSGALAIERLRMDRQNSALGSVLRQFACAGRTYGINPGETIEVWAETSGAANPRLRIDWGSGEPASPDATGCGSCLLRHTYRNPGVFQVTVTLDDRVSTTVTRRFVLATLEPQPLVPTATVTIACTPSAPPPVLAPGGPSIALAIACHGVIGSLFGSGEGSLSGSGFSCSSTTGGTCGPLTVPVGTVITVTATGKGVNDRISSWQGVCAGIGTGVIAATGSCTFVVTGNTTLGVVFYVT